MPFASISNVLCGRHNLKALLFPDSYDIKNTDPLDVRIFFVKIIFLRVLCIFGQFAKMTLNKVQ